MTLPIDEQYQALQEFVTAAKQRLNKNAWGYIVGAAETETTHKRNRQAIESLALRPRVLNDVSQVSCNTTLFGRPARLPVVLCPVGGLESFDKDGALSVARGAGNFGVPMMLSSVSAFSIAEVTQCYREAWVNAGRQNQAGSNESSSTDQIPPVILQLYARDSASTIDKLVDECASIDPAAFCITVDSAVYSRRERDIISRYQKPWRAVGEGNAATYQASLNWADIKRIRSNYDGRLILKGIATAEDAQLAMDHGIDCLYVSNHGGRQLDHATASMDALQEIISSLADKESKPELIVDGAFLRGTDIVKAMALGANGVGLGRLMCLALGAAGSEGIARMLEILEIEIHIALALLGVTSIQDVDASHVMPVSPVNMSDPILAAFPLLEDY